MYRRPSSTTRSYTLFPYTTLFRSNPPPWVGQRAYAAVVCFNTIEAKKKNMPMPATWKDLTKPIYKGQVVMPNPNSSGTGFLDVSSRSEEHTSEIQSLMRISFAVFCLKKNTDNKIKTTTQ